MQVFVGFFCLERMISLFYHLNHFRRNTSDDSIGRHIFGYNRSGGNDGVFADGHTLQDGYIRTEPHFFADVNGFGNHTSPLHWVGDMIERAKRGVMADEGIVVDEDTALVFYHNTGINNNLNLAGIIKKLNFALQQIALA